MIDVHDCAATPFVILPVLANYGACPAMFVMVALFVPAARHRPLRSPYPRALRADIAA